MSDREELRRLLGRFAGAAGLASLPLLVAWEESTQEVCGEVDAEATSCPEPGEALERFRDPEDPWSHTGVCEVDALVNEGRLLPERDECCYSAILTCPSRESLGYGGCMGRPLVQDGRPLGAPVIRAARWPRGPRPDLTGLTTAERARLAQFWIGIAVAEHASIAEFNRIALELLRFGAPERLLVSAQAAALDEARHARRCFALASAYAGEARGPGPFPVAAEVKLAGSLGELAAVTLRDGAIGESCSVWLYRQLGARASDPAVKQVIEGIVREESRHAALAWQVLRWAIDVGGAEVRQACRGELAQLPPLNARPDEPDHLRLRAHGWAPSGAWNRFTMQGYEGAVRPVATALVA